MDRVASHGRVRPFTRTVGHPDGRVESNANVGLSNGRGLTGTRCVSEFGVGEAGVVGEVGVDQEGELGDAVGDAWRGRA
jgi:hypothetical protein